MTLQSYVLYNGTAIINRFFTIVFIERKGITCVLVMECEACEKTFTRKANLKRQEEKCQVVFKCEECDLKPCKITAKIRGNMFINQSSGLSINQYINWFINQLIC